jgi:Fur family transcriptional regulator, ferric uptake regulator
MPDTPDNKSILDEIAARGLRLTSQRKIIVETIQETRQHLDAATLMRLARKREPRINRATVYRTLDLLKRLRLIDELDLMHLEGEKHFYETRTKSGHFHLACLACKKIVEHETPTFEALKQEIADQTGFSIDVIRLEVGGRCPDCRREGSRSSKRGTSHRNRKSG